MWRFVVFRKCVESAREIGSKDSLYKIFEIGNEYKTGDVGIILSVECVEKSLK